ncbi:hypothetical protein SEUCBS139899_001093 [Sporothrix eucalyptigena]
MSTSTCAASDGSFGPVVAAACRGGFDFTLVFEQSFFVILPCSLFLVVVLQLWRTRRQPIHTLPADWLCWTKLAVAFGWMAVQLASLVLWATHTGDDRPSTAIPASVLAFVAASAVCAVSYREHTRSWRPSFVLGIFLSLTALLDVAVVRTLWLRADTALATVASVGLGLKVVLLVLEALSKDGDDKNVSREAVSGPYSIALFWWLNRLFVRGFRSTLTLDNLSKLEDEFASDVLADRMQASWDRVQSNRTANWPLLRALGSALMLPLLLPLPARLVFMAFNYAQPFLIMTATNYVQQKPADDTSSGRDKNNGYGLIGAAALIYVGIAVSRGQYNYLLYRSVTKVRGCLVGLIYQKTLTVSSSLSAKDKAGDAKAALSLMSADVDRIALTVEKVYEIGACTVEAAIAVWLLERQIGWACIAPVILGIVSFAGNSYVAARTPSRLKQWMGATQARVSLTSTVLRNMRAVKAMGTTAPQVFDTLQAAREHELERSAHFRLLVALMNLCGALPRLLSAPLAFALFILPASTSFFAEGGLTAARAFTTLSLLELMTTPLGTVLQSIPQVTAAKACFDRIQDYMRRDDIGDVLAMRESSSSASDTMSEKTLSGGGEGTDEKMIAKVHESPVQSSVPVIQLDNVSLSYSAGKAAVDNAASLVVRDLSLTVGAGQFIVIVGPAGCGKTTLLRALTGSQAPTKGSISRRHAEMAYCQQIPWLVNTTVRDNIVGPADNGSVDGPWYDTVCAACALNDKDAQEKLPEGDEVVGSGGAVLSGGQKQRVALARAVYARKPVVVLDDVLRALDFKTEQTVFGALVAPGGLLRRCDTTTIMVTSSLHHLATADADLILSMHADGSTTQYHSYVEMGDDVVAEIERPRGGPESDQSQQQNASQPGLSLQNTGTSKQKSKAVSDEEKKKKKEKEAARRSGDIKTYQTYGQSMGWSRAWTFLAIAMAFAVVSKISQYWVTQFTDNVNINRSLFIGIYFLFSVAALVLSLVSFWWMMIVIIPVSGSNLHKMLLAAVFQAPLSFITSTDVGVILNRFSQDMSYATAYLPISTMNTVTTVLVCIVQFAFIAAGSGYLAVALPFLVGVVYLLQKFYLATSRQLRFLDLENKSPLYTALSETIEGLPTIRTFGWARAFAVDFLHRLDDSQRPVYMLYCIQRWLNLVLDLIVAALAVLLLAFATQLKSTSTSATGTAAAAALGLAMINMLGFGQSLSQFIFFYTELETSLGAIARIREYVTEIDPEDGPASAKGQAEDNWPERGNIVFDHVTASYGKVDGNSDDDQHLDVLKDVSLHIPAGKLVGIRGRTGSGKSSLTMALLRLIDLRGPCTISIDDVDLATLPRQIVRSRITTVPQEPFFPPTHTLRKVLAGSRGERGLTDAEIRTALEAVGLLEHVVSKLGDKDDTATMLDRKMSDLPLSAGQQQQFGLASALLQHNRVVILDECTSAMDAATEARIKSLLRGPHQHRGFTGKTVLMVAHRTSMLDICDMVVEMDKGRVVGVENRESGDDRPA